MIAAELRGGNKPSLNEALGWIGSRVDDIYGANVGRLEDVWIDPGTGAPRWLLVREGRFGGRTTLIPFEDATAGAGHVWVPYEREVVRGAPEIEPGAPLTHQVEAALRSHYAASAPTSVTGGRGAEGAQAPADPTDTVSGLGTATVRLHGAADAGHRSPHAPEQPRQPPPQPHRHVLREQPGPAAERGALPPYSLPARPAPPIAAPPQPPPAPPQEPPAPPYAEPRPAPPQPPYEPPPLAYPQAPPPPRQAYQQPPSPPQQYPQAPQHYAPPHPQWASQAYPPQAPPAPDPIEALRSLAASPGVHYVEIELVGELSIRGELRGVRVIPRD